MCAICIVWSRHLVPTDSLIDTTLHLVFLECICVLVIIKSSIYMNCCCHLWLNTGLECGNWGSFAIFFFNVTVYMCLWGVFFSLLLTIEKWMIFCSFILTLEKETQNFSLMNNLVLCLWCFLTKLLLLLLFLFSFTTSVSGQQRYQTAG